VAKTSSISITNTPLTLAATLFKVKPLQRQEYYQSTYPVKTCLMTVDIETLPVFNGKVLSTPLAQI